MALVPSVGTWLGGCDSHSPSGRHWFSSPSLETALADSPPFPRLPHLRRNQPGSRTPTFWGCFATPTLPGYRLTLCSTSGSGKVDPRLGEQEELRRPRMGSHHPPPSRRGGRGRREERRAMSLAPRCHTLAYHPFALILENVRSARNVGHLLQSGVVFGAKAVYLVGLTPDPTNRKVLRGSLGAEQMIPWHVVPTTQSALALLRCTYPRLTVAAAELTDHSKDCKAWLTQYGAASPSSGLAIILGNERRGVDRETLKVCDVHLALPLRGAKESLNVADAGAAVASLASYSLRHVRKTRLVGPVDLEGVPRQYPVELSTHPPRNPVADTFSVWANRRLNITSHPIPYA
eukprot:Sspe_Gene.2882::Locus_958_Transcript_1_1_Confidence_1.000_Length_1536::g.2882::m.2882